MGPPQTRISPHVITSQSRKRSCIQCRKDFSSTGPGNRICRPCKLRNPLTTDADNLKPVNAYGRRGRFGDEAREEC